MANIKTKENETLGEKYYNFKHKSGLDVYVFPKNMTSSYALFATRYGSIDNKFKLEGEDEFTCVPDGIAHFLEHKMFECEDGRDAFELFAETGASANAYTSNRQTAYLFSATDNFYESLEILLDFVTHPYFTKENVQKEQGIIGQELRMYEDSPGSRLQRGLMEALYKNNKVRIDVGGTIESIAEIDAEILYKCYNTFYNLNNMALAVCGAVDAQRVEEICDRVLKKAPEQRIIRDYEDSEEPKEVYQKRSVCELSVSKPIFAIGIKDMDISSDPEQRAKKGYAINILNQMLFSCSGEFYNTLYDNKMISKYLDAYSEHTERYSFIQIYSESSNPEAVYDYFVSFIEKTKKNGLDREDFELAKRVEYASNIKSFDSTEEIAGNIIEDLFDGTDIFDAADIISSISFEYICDLFDSLFKEEYYAMSIVYPSKNN